MREKFLERLREELPHSLTVLVRAMEERDNGVVFVDAALVVERESQKGIVIGDRGRLLRKVKRSAEKELGKTKGVAGRKMG